MSTSSTKVYVIVAADYGKHLESLSDSDPIWIADTVENRSVFEKIWADGSTKARAITSFKVASEETPENWLLMILKQVELHHGENWQMPPYSTLQVVGTYLTDSLRSQLRDYGFGTFEDTPDGFVAYKI